MENEELNTNELTRIITDAVNSDPVEAENSENELVRVIESAPKPVVEPKVTLLTPEQLESDDDLTDEKKKLAAALAAAQKLGIIEDENTPSAETLANTSDTLIEQVRQDYKAGSGLLLPEEAYEDNLDRQAARFAGNVNRVVDNITEKAGTAAETGFRVWAQRALDAIEERWPKTRPLRPAAEKLIEVLGEKVIKAVKEGAVKVADKVKIFVAAATEKVKTATRKVADYIKSFF